MAMRLVPTDQGTRLPSVPVSGPESSTSTSTAASGAASAAGAGPVPPLSTAGGVGWNVLGVSPTLGELARYVLALGNARRAGEGERQELHSILLEAQVDEDDEDEDDAVYNVGAGTAGGDAAAPERTFTKAEAAVMRKMRRRLQAAAKRERTHNLCGRLVREVPLAWVSALMTLLVLPFSIILFVTSVVMTVARSIGQNGWRIRAAFLSLLVLVPAIAAITIYIAAPNTIKDQTPVEVNVGMGTVLVTLSLIPLLFVVSTPHDEYWNKVPGGIHHVGYRWSLANFFSVTATVVCTVQVASFPLSRLGMIDSDAAHRFPEWANRTAIIDFSSGSVDGSSATNTTTSAYYSEIAADFTDWANAALGYYTELLTYNDPPPYLIIVYTCLGCVAIWTIFMTLPILEMLVRIFWIDWEGLRKFQDPSIIVGAPGAPGLDRSGSDVSMLNGGTATATPAKSIVIGGGRRRSDQSTVQGTADAVDDWDIEMASISAAGSPTGGPADGMERTGSSETLLRSQSTTRILVEGPLYELPFLIKPNSRLRIPGGRMGRLRFRIAMGTLLGFRQYSELVHGTLLYFFGDLAYVFMTVNLLRPTDCAWHCDPVSNVCEATVEAIPSMVCWTPWHQYFATGTFGALILYTYTATFCSPLLMGVRDLDDNLDVRTTPRFDVLDRVASVVVVVLYIYIDGTLSFVPVGIHAAICIGMVAFLEYAKPASQPTVLLRSTMYQLVCVIALGCLTAYLRIPWLAFQVMILGVIIVLVGTLVRVIQRNFHVPPAEILEAVRDLGGTIGLEKEGLMRIRGRDQRVLDAAVRSLNEAMTFAPGSTRRRELATQTIALYEQALLASATFIDAAAQLAQLTFDGQLIPRQLMTAARICALVLKYSRRLPKLKGAQRRMLESLLVLATIELGLEDPSPPLTHVHRQLEEMRTRRDQNLADQYSWVLLGLLHEWRARLGRHAPPVGGQLGSYRRNDLVRSALECITTAAFEIPNSHLAMLHLARYYADGVGVPRSADDALETMLVLVRPPHGYVHVYWYIGMLMMKLALPEHFPIGLPGYSLEDRQKWHRDALEAWARGAKYGDPDCARELTGSWPLPGSAEDAPIGDLPWALAPLQLQALPAAAPADNFAPEPAPSPWASMPQSPTASSSATLPLLPKRPPTPPTYGAGADPAAAHWAGGPPGAPAAPAAAALASGMGARRLGDNYFAPRPQESLPPPPPMRRNAPSHGLPPPPSALPLAPRAARGDLYDDQWRRTGSSSSILGGAGGAGPSFASGPFALTLVPAGDPSAPRLGPPSRGSGFGGGALPLTPEDARAHVDLNRPLPPLPPPAQPLPSGPPPAARALPPPAGAGRPPASYHTLPTPPPAPTAPLPAPPPGARPQFGTLPAPPSAAPPEADSGADDGDIFADGEFTTDTLGRPRPLLTTAQAAYVGAWVNPNYTQIGGYY